MRASELASELAKRSYDLCQLLFPNGKRDGNNYCVGNIDGSSGKSLKISIAGSKSGQWCDFAATDQSGDLIGLIKSVKQCSILEACHFAENFLGIKQIDTSFQKKPKNYFRPQIPAIVSSDITFRYLMEKRKISIETLNLFKVYGTDRDMHFPAYIADQCCLITSIGIDRKENGDKIVHQASSGNKELPIEWCLFGWQALSGDERTIIITEGQIDAMSWKEYGYAALSVPAGANNLHWIDNDYDRLSVYDIIFVNMDDDKAGKSAEKEIIKRIGAERCKIITLPFKDINDCLVRNYPKYLIDNLVQNAINCDPDEVKWAGHFEDKICKLLYPNENDFIGTDPGFIKTKGLVLFGKNELSVWTGYSGHGKSQFLGQILLSSIKQGQKVCIASLELKPERFLLRMLRQCIGKKEFATDLEWQKYLHFLNDWVCTFNFVGTVSPNRLLEVFEYVFRRYGIKVFLIDSFMMVSIAEEDLAGQKLFMEKLCAFKNRYDCHIHLIAHPRKISNFKNSSEKDAPTKHDIKGTGTITDLADNVYSIWRNKEKEEIMQKYNNNELFDANLDINQIRRSPDIIFSCLKQRNEEFEGKFSFWFCKQSYQYLENCEDNAKPFFIFEGMDNQLTNKMPSEWQ